MAAETNGRMSNGNGSPTAYTLYHNYYSICSIMMRYLVRIRGEPKDDASAMDIEARNVDIFSEEQFSEEYLCRINPHGQVSVPDERIFIDLVLKIVELKVPVLGSPVAFSFPVNQTSQISTYVSERHPNLLPPAHAAEITRLVNKMHELNFFTLSFRGSPKLASGFADAALRRLQDDTISDEYRKALEHKVMM